MSDDFLKAALPPSYSRTGRPRPRRTSAAGRIVDGKPTALTGRRGARRSFWDVGPQGPTVGGPRQTVRWPIPNMCLVPSTGSTVAATTETRGVATRELTLVARRDHPATWSANHSIPGCALLTRRSIYGFAGDSLNRCRQASVFGDDAPLTLQARRACSRSSTDRCAHQCRNRPHSPC